MLFTLCIFSSFKCPGTFNEQVCVFLGDEYVIEVHLYPLNVSDFRLIIKLR